LELIQPTFAGALSDAGHGQEPRFVPFPDARRFDISTRSLAATAGAAAAMRWLRESVGLERAYACVQKLADTTRSLLKEIPGVRLLTPPKAPGSLTTFAVDGRDPNPIVEHLQRHGVYTRTVPISGGSASPGPPIRLSLGVWNRTDDPLRIVEALDRAIAETAHDA